MNIPFHDYFLYRTSNSKGRLSIEIDIGLMLCHIGYFLRVANGGVVVTILGSVGAVYLCMYVYVCQS